MKVTKAKWEVGGEREREEIKKKLFTIFSFSDSDCYIVISYTGQFDTIVFITKAYIYADTDKALFHRVTSVNQQINAKNHVMSKESQDSLFKMKRSSMNQHLSFKIYWGEYM